jgi:type II secretory pathway pseudopilin PulG
MPMPFARRNGMTLMEVVISILLVAMVLAGVATAVTWSMSTIRAARESSAALQAAQQEMERMRNSNFGTIASHTFPVPVLRNQDGSAVNGSVAVDSQNTRMKKVSVQVSWVSAPLARKVIPVDRTMRVSLVTYITKDGIDQR